MGDITRAASERPAVIGVIDGVFEVVPTVWHKEILWVMARGVPVYGAASIGAAGGGAGALRNARIDDDEVALLHGPEEAGFPPVIEAMINVRATLEAARAAGVLAAADAARIAGGWADDA